MFKNKAKCWKCKYGWSINGLYNGNPNNVMCLYFHDTGKHRKGDDNTCESFVELTEAEKKKRQVRGRDTYERGSKVVFY